MTDTPDHICRPHDDEMPHIVVDVSGMLDAIVQRCPCGAVRVIRPHICETGPWLGVIPLFSG